MKIEIYDPPMCCSSGVCGPAVNPALLAMNDAILALKKQGITVERYNLRSDYMSVKDNALVMPLIRQRGLKSLPITVIKGQIFRIGAYPSYEELCRELGIEPLKSHKPVTIQVG